MRQTYLLVFSLTLLSLNSNAQLCNTIPTINPETYGSGGNVTMSWTTPADAFRCVIFFKVGSLTAPISITNPTGLLNSFTFDGYTPGEIYYYRVKCACDPLDLRADLTDWSNIDSFVGPTSREGQFVDFSSIANRVWPNPASSTLYLSAATGSSIEIFTTAGIRVRTLYALSEVTKVNLEALQSGMYIYKIYNKETGTSTGKFNIE